MEHMLTPAIGQQDDAMVDRFANAMEAKLAKKRAQGFINWLQCSSQDLSFMLIDHVEKGNPIDVGNLSAMLYDKKSSIQHKYVE